MSVVLKKTAQAVNQLLPAVLSEAEAAEFLGVPPERLRRLRYQRRGPPTLRIGRQRIIRRGDLLQWIADNAR